LIIRKALTSSLVAIGFTIRVVSILLLMTPALAASGRGFSGLAMVCQSEITGKAEGLLKEALTLSGTEDQKLVRERFSKAMRLWIQMRQPEKAAQSALLMGDSYKRMNQFQESLYYYQQALQVKPLSSRIKAFAFNSIAELYVELYNLDLARWYYEQAVAQARVAKDVSVQVKALSGLAVVYYQSKEVNRTLACIKQARQLNRQQENEEMEAALLHLTGRIAQEQGLTDHAQEAFKDALAIYQRTGHTAGQGKLLCSISNLYLSLGQTQKALDHAQQAVELAGRQADLAKSDADKLRVKEWQWRTLLALARAQRTIGQKEMAVKSYFRAIYLIELIWWSVVNATDVGAATFGEERQTPYQELADILIEQGQIDKAYHVAEQAKSRAILGLIEARRTTRSARQVDPDGKLGELSRSIAGLRTQLLSPQSSLKQRAKLESDIEAAEFALQEAQAKTEMDNSRERNAWFRPAAVEQVQKKLNPDTECLVEFFLGESRSFVWFISAGHLKMASLPGQKEIQKTVEDYLTSINTKPNNLYLKTQLVTQQGLAEKLFATLFGELAEQLTPGKRLIVVPDGILYYLPFETLRHNGRYLLEAHEISYLPSASMLELLQNSKNNSETDKLDLLAFGAPIFGLQTSRQKHSGNAIDAQTLRAFDGFQLAALPGTGEEVREIAKLFTPDRCQVYLGKESTEEALKAVRRSYRRLHIASHALVDQKNPFRSAIVLTLDADPQEDGFLEMGEIAALDLDCELVVLSACQTGRGKLFSGEGVVGLSRAFLYAGARSVVVSLWNVSDISTSQLMKDFYQHLVRGDRNAQALREAKLQMLRSNKETRHPFYWAPFILIGKS
jgi:CHAT domain-containing protein